MIKTGFQKFIRFVNILFRYFYVQNMMVTFYSYLKERLLSTFLMKKTIIFFIAHFHHFSKIFSLFLVASNYTDLWISFHGNILSMTENHMYILQRIASTDIKTFAFTEDANLFVASLNVRVFKTAVFEFFFLQNIIWMIFRLELQIKISTNFLEFFSEDILVFLQMENMVSQGIFTLVYPSLHLVIPCEE